jgi:ABC-2 type transport system permease protein
VLIWYTNLSNIIDLMVVMMGTGRYPREIASNVAMPVIVFLPFLLVVNVPVKILLGRGNLLEFAGFSIFAVSLFLLSRWFWKFALRFYTSASG